MIKRVSKIVSSKPIVLPSVSIDTMGSIKYKIDKVSGMESFSTTYSSDQEWAYPDLDHAYELMLYFYENQI